MVCVPDVGVCLGPATVLAAELRPGGLSIRSSKKGFSGSGASLAGKRAGCSGHVFFAHQRRRRLEGARTTPADSAANGCHPNHGMGPISGFAVLQASHAKRTRAELTPAWATK